MTHRYLAPFRIGGPAEITARVAEQLLDAALGDGASYADVYFEYSASGGYALDESILKSVARSVSMGLGVRVRRGEATGYAYCESFEMETMLRTARTAAKIAADGRRVTPVQLSTRETPSRYYVPMESTDVDGVTKRALLQRADEAARTADSRVTRVDVSLNELVKEIVVATSTGAFARDRQPLLRFGIRVIAEDQGKRESGSSGGGGRYGLEYFDLVTPEAHAAEAVRQALINLDGREAPAGQMDVVLAPGDSGILLHEAVGHGLEADFNRKRTSNYTDQLGELVASELCTVVDDATLRNSRGAVNVDDEGQLPTSVTLIERGRLVAYMHDQQSAEHFGLASSGNGRRESFRSHPMPRMTNTLLGAGTDSPEDILRSVKRGVYAKKFGGGQVDIANGDFVFSLTEGYLIEDGRITAPLKGVNLIGNGPDVMRRVTMLGHDFETSDGIWTCGKDGQSVPVGVGCPTIKISTMTVGGTQIGAA